MKSVLAVSVWVLLTGGCSFVGPGIYHPVSGGETLWSIAGAYGVDAGVLESANRRVGDPSRLRPGDVIYIPGARRVKRVAEPSLRFIWPVQGEVIAGFGRHGYRRSMGINIKTREGDPVAAAESGTVVFVSDDFRIYGKTIIIDHGSDYATVYAHNRKNTVTLGENVSRGQKIAEAGDSGSASQPQLYFEIRYREEPRNPLHLLP